MPLLPSTSKRTLVDRASAWTVCSALIGSAKAFWKTLNSRCLEAACNVNPIVTNPRQQTFLVLATKRLLHAYQRPGPLVGHGLPNAPKFTGLS
jgi:hypothetical protein